MIPQPQTSLKIEDLKARVRADAKSRHFYALAEELRKIGRLDEAEQTLRSGLIAHPTYLSAWISLGKVLRDGGKKAEACDTFLRALTIDPGNVVAARLAADNYFELGEKVEAIKKYKLVHALMPSDEEVEGIIDRLDRELNPDEYLSQVDTAAPAVAYISESPAQSEHPFRATSSEAPVSGAAMESKGTGSTAEDVSPLSTEHIDNPFGIESAEAQASQVGEERPVEGDDVFAAVSVASAEPFPADTGAPFAAAGPEAGASGAIDEPPSAGMSVFEKAGSESVWDDSEIPVAADKPGHAEPLEEAPPAGDPGLATVTIGDLYAQQGHHEAAREIYAKVVEREPANEAAVERLRALEPAGNAGKISRLQRWLGKVGPRDTTSV
ncbi:MAG TPA: tetratricopeptide repeat protein [Thermoanaerobaculia bacterium]|nr:tetratricopeptide repeat protein [Thermoanaerobaculia bacterium]